MRLNMFKVNGKLVINYNSKHSQLCGFLITDCEEVKNSKSILSLEMIYVKNDTTNNSN